MRDFKVSLGVPETSKSLEKDLRMGKVFQQDTAQVYRDWEEDGLGSSLPCPGMDEPGAG